MEDHELEVLNRLVNYAEQHQSLTVEERRVAEVVRSWLKDRLSVRPVCPYCESVAPYGDGRHQWIRAHMDSPTHRMWWVMKKRLLAA